MLRDLLVRVSAGLLCGAIAISCSHDEDKATENVGSVEQAALLAGAGGAAGAATVPGAGGATDTAGAAAGGAAAGGAPGAAGFGGEPPRRGSGGGGARAPGADLGA